MTTRCGKKRSNSGKPFTAESIRDHESGCCKCLFAEIREWIEHPRRWSIRHPLDSYVKRSLYKRCIDKLAKEVCR